MIPKLEPFYFFADLIDYHIGDKHRRTVVAKIKDVSLEQAEANLKRLYIHAYRTKNIDSFKVIPATEDDWIEYQKQLGVIVEQRRYKNQDPTKKRGGGRKASKLSEDDVRAIRKDFRQYQEIASSYGVSKSMIQSIKNGQRRAEVV